MAHAVVAGMKFPQDRAPDEGLKPMEAAVITRAQSQPGFDHGAWLHDGEARGMGEIILADVLNAEWARGVPKPAPGRPARVSIDAYPFDGQAQHG